MSKFQLKAEVRETTGKEKAKKLRAAGKYPAIVYGAGEDPVSVTLDIRETEVVLTRIHGEKVLVDLAYGGKTDKVFLRKIERDPASEKLLHIDFYRVHPDREIDTKVPVHHVGTAQGVRMGGLLEHGLRELQIHCLPGNVPPHIDVDVSHLEIGHSIHVSDLSPMPGVKVLSSPDAVLFSVAGKQAEEPAPGAAAEEPAAEAPAEEPAAAE